MKIVFIVSRFPYPLEKGDKLRAYQHIVNLHKCGHQVHLIALSDCPVSENHKAKLLPLCCEISILPLSKPSILRNLCFSFLRNLPLQVGYFYSTNHKKKIYSIIAESKPDVIYCQLIRTARFVTGIKNIPLAIDYQDAFSRGTYQRMLKAPVLVKWLYKREYNLVLNYEADSYNQFNKHFIISEQDRKWLNITGEKEVTILPNGIDTEFYAPVNSEKKFDITFVGNMQYPPNVDGAVFLIKYIMPIVWKDFPNAKVQIGGANPVSKVKALASENVTVTGWVDDIRDCYKNTLIFIAPMRIGTGLQNKLLEAMAMKIPSITTPLSFEPLGAQKDTEVLVGKDAQSLARYIISLLSDENLRNRLAEAGCDFVKRNYSIQYSRDLLNNQLSALQRK